MQEICDSIRGIDTFWLESDCDGGDLPILFFVHGFPDSPETFKHQFMHFQNSHKVIAPYLRRLKDHKVSAKRCAMDAVLLDNLAILRKVNPKGDRKVIVIGHDIGVMHAYELAYALGDRLNGVFFLNGLTPSQLWQRKQNWRQIKRSTYIGLFQVPVVSELLWNSMENFWVSRAFRMGKGEGDTNYRYAPLFAHYRQGIQKTLLHNHSSKPRKLAAPLKVLFGVDDPYLEAPTQDEMDKLANDCEIRVLDGGHWLHQEFSSKINQYIEKVME